MKKAVAGLVAVAVVSCLPSKETRKAQLPEDRIPQKIAVSFEGQPRAALILNGKEVKVWDAQAGAFHQIMFSHDGRYVFIANSSENTVHVLDGNTFEHIKDIRVGDHPTHMSLSEDGKVLAVSNEVSGDVSFISVETLTEIRRVGGFATPHFVRNWGDRWFVANAGANRLSVIDAKTFKVVKEFSVEGEPTECKDEECGFFDIGLKPVAKLGAGVHAGSGKFIVFNLETLKVVRKGRIHYPLEFMRAKVPILSDYDQMLYIPFAKGVFVFNTTAGEDAGLWVYEADTYRSDAGTEIPGGVLVPMFDEKLVAIVGPKGELKKLVDVGGNPQMVAHWNGITFLSVATRNSTWGKVIAIDEQGNVYEIAEIEGKLIHGIHIPGVFPRCH